MKQPTIVEKFADNGEHSHWELINTETGEVLWSESEENSKENEIKKELATAKECWNNNKKIDAIRIVRDAIPMLGLIEAKTYCEKNF